MSGVTYMKHPINVQKKKSGSGAPNGLLVEYSDIISVAWSYIEHHEKRSSLASNVSTLHIAKRPMGRCMRCWGRDLYHIKKITSYSEGVEPY